MNNNTVFSRLVLLVWALFFITNVHAQTDPYYKHHPKNRVNISESNLPLVIIELKEEMPSSSTEDRAEANMKIIWDREGGVNRVSDVENIDFDGRIEIKYRGNTSYTFAEKKPWGIKIRDEKGDNVKVPILGMGKDHDWALLAQYSDKSLFRDVLIYELMAGAFYYIPRVQLCEVILDGVYQGVYQMAERPRNGNSRIDVKKPGSSGTALTGGYIVYIDHAYDQGFHSKYGIRDLYERESSSKKPFYKYVYPDVEDLTPTQIDYLKSYIDEMEQAVISDDFKDSEKGYRAYFDTISMMNYIIAQELTKNIDGYRASTPMYKFPDNIDPRFKFSLWDFNIAFGIADYADGFSTRGWVFNNNRFPNDRGVPWYFKRALQDEQFLSNIKGLWGEYRKERLSDKTLLSKIDSLSNLLNSPQERNFQAWPTWGNAWVWPVYYYAESYNDEISELKKWVLDRAAWIDSQWLEKVPNVIPNGDFEAARSRGAKSGINLSEWTVGEGEVSLTDQSHTGEYALTLKGSSKVYQVITELLPGKYDLKVWIKTQINPKAKVYLKYHNGKSGDNPLNYSIMNYRSYSLIEIKGVEISNYFAELGFTTEGNSGALFIDDIELKRQDSDSEGIDNVPGEDDIRVMTYPNEGAIEILFDSFDNQALLVEVFDILGRKIHSETLTSDWVRLNHTFSSNQNYIIRIGNIVQKVTL